MSLRLATVDADGSVWRIGRRPDPWGWTGWQYATGGRFGGRWDDSQGHYRTCYAGDSLYAVLLEVLAPLRPDPELTAPLGEIIDNADDGSATARPGAVTREWLDVRVAASAHLDGRYCVVGHSASLATIREQFAAKAVRWGVKDLDAGSLRRAEPRILTQTISTWLYLSTDLDGVRFASRHGDECLLWGIFERPGDLGHSRHLSSRKHVRFGPRHPDFVAALDALGLSWEPSLRVVD